jgi:hypothetical protein
MFNSNKTIKKQLYQYKKLNTCKNNNCKQCSKCIIKMNKDKKNKKLYIKNGRELKYQVINS